MDKYTAYVVIVYVVTFALLFGYLAWIWLRLRAVKDMPVPAPQTAGVQPAGLQRPEPGRQERR